MAGQSLFLGVALALLDISAAPLFLVEFGSDKLPYVYIAVAIFVSLVFYGMAELQKRWTLTILATVTLIVLTDMFFLARFVLILPNSRWISFGLMVVYRLGLQTSFVVLGGQAGRLFNVRQMKRLFPIIVAGMTIGYMIAGFSVSSLVRLLGKTENLLLVAGVSMLVSLGLLLTTTTRFHSILAQAEKRTGRQQTKSLGQLLKKRFVKLIFSYQMLSAVGTLSVIFLFIHQAETTFANAAELAGLAETIEEALAITEHPIRETAAWALHSLAPDKYQAHAAALAVDTNPHVARLAAHLNR